MLKYVLAFLVLSLVIIIHEFGHFVVAKTSGVVVKEFSLGMGPRILKFKRKETMYSIKLFLFGGSCQMLGEDEDSDSEGSFNSKSVGKRIAIIAAGPVFNFLLAFILSVVLIGIAGYDPCIIHSVDEGSAAYEAGLMPGDKITEVNGTNVTFYGDYSMYVLLNDGAELKLTVERDGEEYDITVTPEYVDKDVYQMGVLLNSDSPSIAGVNEGSPAEEAGMKTGDIILSIDGNTVNKSEDITPLVQKSEGNKMTVVVKRGDEELVLNFAAKTVHSSYYDYGYSLSGERVKCSPFETIGYAIEQVGYWIKSVFVSFKLLFKGVASFNDMAGPVGIVSALGNVVEQSKPDGALYIFLNLANWCIMISANLGVMNLLPIPALDGGRLVFLFIEAIRRKPVPREKEGMVHFVGIVLLMILMVVILVNDIRKLF